MIPVTEEIAAVEIAESASAWVDALLARVHPEAQPDRTAFLTEAANLAPHVQVGVLRECVKRMPALRSDDDRRASLAASTAEFGPLTLISVAIGAATTVTATKIGAGIGAVAGAIIAAMSNCPNCGLCFEMAFYLLLGRRMVPVIPILILPRSGDCTVLIPPGCP